MAKRVAITTTDNPYDPFEDFVSWYNYDEFVGKHHTCSLLAEFAPNSESFTDEFNDELSETAIDQIILSDPEGLYVKLTKDA